MAGIGHNSRFMNGQTVDHDRIAKQSKARNLTGNKNKKPQKPERDRAVFDVMRAIKGKTNAEVVKGTFVAASTVAKWRKPLSQGGTRYPHHATMAAVLSAAGFAWVIVPKQKAALAKALTNVNAEDELDEPTQELEAA